MVVDVVVVAVVVDVLLIDLANPPPPHPRIDHFIDLSKQKRPPAVVAVIQVSNK